MAELSRVLALTSTCRCGLRRARGTGRARRRMPTCRSSPAATPPCRPSVWTSDRRRLRRRGPGPLPHLVRQHGRPPRGAARRHAACVTAHASSRCARGRPSSSAAATACPHGRSRRPTRPPPPSSRSVPACGRTSSRATRRSIRRRSTWCTTGSTRSCGGDRSAEATEIVRRHGVDPDKRSVVFVGRITRQKGLPYLLRAARPAAARRPARALRRAPDTPEILAEAEGLMNELQAQREGVVWIPTCCPARGRRPC